METEIKKAGYSGVVTAPPSKSESHRALICAALCREEKPSVIRGIADSEDMKATLDCIEALGAKYSKDGDTVTVWGCDPADRENKEFPCRESGSTLRFFLPLCLLSEKEAVLSGSEKLLSRPLDVYEEICVGQGLRFVLEDTFVSVAGKLGSGYFKVRGDESSQFITGLMLALPLLDEYSVIELIPPVVSVPYIAMTAKTMKQFGIRLEFTDDDRIIIPGGQKYTPCDINIEGDWSNAAFFLAMSVLGHDVEVEGLERETLQGDYVIKKLLGKLRRGHPTIDVNDCPDLAPILLASASAMGGVTLVGTSRLRIKESDRGQAMADELSKLGVSVVVGEDSIDLYPPRELKAPTSPLDSHGDHRIAMSCAVLLTFVGGRISGAEAVGKSYPDFFDVLSSLEENG